MPNKIRQVNLSLKNLIWGRLTRRMIGGFGKNKKINRRGRREGRRERKDVGMRNMRGETFLQKSFSPHPSSKNSYMAGGIPLNAGKGRPASRPLTSPFSKGGYRGIFLSSLGLKPRNEMEILGSFYPKDIIALLSDFDIVPPFAKAGLR
jgi:hypothetical protein